MILTTEVLRVMLVATCCGSWRPCWGQQIKEEEENKFSFVFFFFFYFPLNLVTLLVFHTVQAHSQASRLWQNTQSTVVNLNSSWTHR